MAEQVADVAPAGLDRARISFAPQGLELGEDLFDRIEIGRVAGQEEQFGPGGADQTAHDLALVAALLWLPRLSMTTTSPERKVGTKNCST